MGAFTGPKDVNYLQLLRKLASFINLRQLLDASSVGDLDFLRYLMKRDRVLDIEVDDQNWLGRTALHEGILHNREDVVQHLVKIECASARIADKEGNTALHFAVEGGYLRMVRLLLEVDADVNADNLDIEPRSPLQLAKRKLRKVELENGRISTISIATQPSTSTSGAEMIHWLLTHRPFLLPPKAPHFFEKVRNTPSDISPAAVKACKLHVITAVEFFKTKRPSLVEGVCLTCYTTRSRARHLVQLQYCEKHFRWL